jgi:tRNA (guanosine-2'-O-)-methyltransferase
MDELKSQGFQIVATTPHTNDVLLPDFDVTKKSAFFFGTEISGLSDIVLDQADAFVRIPMYGFTESYNISVSAALVLHDVVNRLKKSEVDWALSEEELMDKRIDWAVKSLKSGPQVLAQLLSKADS